MKRNFFPALIFIPLLLAGFNETLNAGDPPSKKQASASAEAPVSKQETAVREFEKRSEESKMDALKEEIEFMKTGIRSSGAVFIYSIDNEETQQFLNDELLVPVREALSNGTSFNEFSRCPSGYNMVYSKDNKNPGISGSGIVQKGEGCRLVPQLFFTYNYPEKSVLIRISRSGEFVSVSEYLAVRKKLNS